MKPDLSDAAPANLYGPSKFEMSEPSMHRPTSWHSTLRATWGRGVGLLGLSVLLASCGPDAQADAVSQGDATRSFQRVINVEVLPLEPRVFEQRLRLAGTVQANVDVTISAEESGVVRSVQAERGVLLQEGQAIFQVDDRILQSQVDEAEARAAFAREGWERRQRLFEVDGVGSELAYLEARYQADQAAAALNSLQERLRRTVIRSPISGTLETRLVEVGTMVAAGTPVARIVQVDPVKILAGIPERYAADVSTSSRATVTFDALGPERYEARVRFVGTTVNPSNRTFEIELVVPNSSRVIKPEMIANVEVVLNEREAAVVVPQEAVVRVEGGFVAFVVEERDGESVATVRDLVVGTTQRNEVVVEEGLEPGDRLIVLGQNQVANGDRVQVVRTREVQTAGAGS